MEPIEFNWLENILKIKALGKSSVSLINNISTDTRTIKKGDLFVPLQGENFDGHNYINAAIEKGAGGAIVNNSKFKIQKLGNLKKREFFFFEVEDTLAAFQKIAKAYREKLNFKMINITGSNGKTTTKDMAYAILSTTFKTYKSQKNFNNEIGIPQALLCLDNAYEVCVLELGMTHKGDINQLIELTSPDIRALTNIGPSHLQNFSSMDELAQTKGEIFNNYKNGDIALINLDDERVKFIAKNFQGKKIFFGINNNADIKAENIDNGSFNLVILGKDKIKVSLNVIGKHNIYNALCAAGIGISQGVSIKKIAQALNSFVSEPGRMELSKISHVWIIDDTYNANPVSMRRAIETINETGFGKQKILVLGDMLELGEKEIYFHEEIGKKISEIKIDFLITCGTLAQHIAEKALKNGMSITKIFKFNNSDEAKEQVLNLINEDTLILVKGSRSMKMEKIVEYLKKKLGKE